MNTSRTGLLTLLAVVLAGITQAQPAGVLKFDSLPVRDMLEFYGQLTGKKLVIAPNVDKALLKITLRSDGPTSRDETARTIERALAEQAGVIVTPLDNNQVSVTYDEALARIATVRPSNRLPSPDTFPAYEVDGEVSWIGRDGKYVEGGKRTSGFTVCVKGVQWSVTVFPSNWPTRIRFDEKVPTPISETIAFDGTNGYSLKRYRPGDFDETQIAKRWLGNTPASHGSTRELYPVWYAFASHNYSGSISNDTILPLEPGVSAMTGTLQTTGAFPTHPVLIVGTNLQQTLRWEFMVRSFTNAFGLSFPAEAVTSYASVGLGGFAEPWSTVELKLREVGPGCKITSFIPDLKNQHTVIYDWTYKDGNPPHEAYIATNRWPTRAEVDAFYFR
jgi:hypothetical protein